MYMFINTLVESDNLHFQTNKWFILLCWFMFIRNYSLDKPMLRTFLKLYGKVYLFKHNLHGL